MSIAIEDTRTNILSVGEHRGRPRIWIEGRYLERFGFRVGERFSALWEQGTLRLLLDPEGDRKVSGNPKRAPILDLNTERIEQVLGQTEKIQVEIRDHVITITPAKTERRRATRLRDGSAGSIFSGGGLLDEAARLAGYTSVFGVEHNPAYAEIWEANHPGKLFVGDIAQVPFHQLPQVELLIGGIPCEPFSLKRRDAGRRELPEEHPLGDMTVWALFAIEATNPRVVVLEEVPQFLRSGAGVILLKALERMGYHVESRIVGGQEYGSVTRRERAVIVATDGPIHWPEPVEQRSPLGQLLLPPDHPEVEWFNRDTKPWLFRHWEEQTARGNQFASQQLTPDTLTVQAISKRYFSGQGDAPVVKDIRPGRDGWFRWLTLTEVRRIMGLPDGYYLGSAKTTAGEVLGQGVLVDVFRRIIESVAPR